MSSVMSKVMMKGMMEWASEVVKVISGEYNLDSSKCMALIESRWCTGVSASSVKSVSKGKRLIPLPFNRETVDLNGCHGVTYNHGLFTQCCNIKLEEETYCNSCKTETETSSSGKPLCGTIEDRSDPEFKDSENRKPVHYLSVLRKLRVKPEAAIEEAGKQNITIDAFHLQELPKPVKPVKEKVVKEPKVKPVKVVKEKEPKPVKEKVVKEPKVKPVKVVKEKPVKEPKPVKEKVVKEKVPKPVKEKKESVGRPKSTKKPIETAAVEDLFASLVAEELSNASGSESETEQVKEVQSKKSETQKKTETPKKSENELKEMFVELFGEDDEVSELSGSDSESKKTDKKEKQPKKTDKKEKQDKKTESESERKERAAMQNEEKEQKLREAAAAKENKLKEAAAAKLEKEAAAAAEKEKKALAEAEKKAKAAAEKEQKLQEAAALKEQKLKEVAAEKERKAQEIALEKEKKAKEAAEKKAQSAAAKKQKEVVASEAPKKVEEPEPVEVTKVTVKRITIDGKEYLKSNTNMLYDPKTREEVGIYNSETGGIDALPEESDDEEEVEDDYDSEDN